MPADTGPIPRTMAAYGMRGTPTLLIIDRAGRLRHQHFGQMEDMALGAQVALLMGEAMGADAAADAGEACSMGGTCG
jgi:hypothetical protein